ncbi:hypothetical protein A4X13_0g9646, partial [Tilletia indica]
IAAISIATATALVFVRVSCTGVSRFFVLQSVIAICMTFHLFAVNCTSRSRSPNRPTTFLAVSDYGSDRIRIRIHIDTAHPHPTRGSGTQGFLEGAKTDIPANVGDPSSIRFDPLRRRCRCVFEFDFDPDTLEETPTAAA